VSVLFKDTLLQLKAELATALVPGARVSLELKKYFLFDKKTEKLIKTVTMEKTK
jgi:hypothetical protein